VTSFFKKIMPTQISETRSQHLAGIFVLAAILYNAVLAIINAYVVPVNATHVMGAEILIVAAGFAFIAAHIRYIPTIIAPLSLLAISVLIFLYVSFVQESFYIKSFRDILLIVVFFLLGGIATEKTLISTFRIASIVTLIFLLVEVFYTDLYVSIFQPASYYANTRGIEQLATDETGLFRNALGYETRFSVGILSAHRVSSLFLEQVSLANFIMILTIFIAAFWQKICAKDKILFIVVIILVLLTNSSRTALLLVPLFTIGYFIFPLLPRYSTLLYMPVILALAFLFFYDPDYISAGRTDDLVGRMGFSLNLISNMGSSFFIGSTNAQILNAADSGYAYYIYTQTIFGLIYLWLFSCFAVAHNSPSDKRYAHGLNLYIFVNLLFSAAIFSIKVSSLLWFVAGYLYYNRYKISQKSD